jgi:superfamily II DNA or RNA helicase
MADNGKGPLRKVYTDRLGIRTHSPPQEPDPFDPVEATFGFSTTEVARLNALSPERIHRILTDMDINTVFRVAFAAGPESPIGACTREIYKLDGVPLNKNYTLFPYQMDTLSWMRKREEAPFQGMMGGLLCLTMGMGKTLISLVHMLSSIPPPSENYPNLVVCSKTVMYEWRNDIEKFFGGLVPVLFFHADFCGKEVMNNVTRADLLHYRIVITTYDVCMSVTRKYPKIVESCLVRGDEPGIHYDKVLEIVPRSRDMADKPSYTGKRIIYGTPWNIVICDESHKFANPSTITYRVIMALYGRKRWCLTGTPIRNYTTDIWSQMRWLGYSRVSTAREWRRVGLEEFQRNGLSACIRNMSYEEGNVTLPDKVKITREVRLEGMQEKCYKDILDKTIIAYDKMMGGLITYSCILALFTRLRQACIAPYLMTCKSNGNKKANSQADRLLAASTSPDTEMGRWCHNRDGESGIYARKVTEVLDILESMPKGEKALVFSMFSSSLDLLMYAIHERTPGIFGLKIDGTVSGKARGETLRLFRESDKVDVLFLNYGVGAEGLNLTQANHVICIEPWWTDASHRQAASRCWRTGQTKDVKVYQVIAEDTIEQRVLKVCEGKNVMSANFLEGTNVRVPQVDKYTLGRVLRGTLQPQAVPSPRPLYSNPASASSAAAALDNTSRDNECCVCMYSMIGVRLEPCGHECMCEHCALALEVRKCPLCRSEFERWVLITGWQSSATTPISEVIQEGVSTEYDSERVDGSTMRDLVSFLGQVDDVSVGAREEAIQSLLSNLGLDVD